MSESGLVTDLFFIAALKSNGALMGSLPARDVYDNVANPDYDMDNVQLPYVIVNNDGGGNVSGTKDERFEAGEDTVTVSIRIAAKSRKQLADIATAVRETVLAYVTDMEDRINGWEEPEGWRLKPDDYQLTFSDIAHDMLKPSHTMVLYYQCRVGNHIADTDNGKE